MKQDANSDFIGIIQEPEVGAGLGIRSNFRTALAIFVDNLKLSRTYDVGVNIHRATPIPSGPPALIAPARNGPLDDPAKDGKPL